MYAFVNNLLFTSYNLKCSQLQTKLFWGAILVPREMQHNASNGYDKAIHSPKSDGHTLAETGRRQHRVVCGTGYKGCQWGEPALCSPLCLGWRPESHQTEPRCHDTIGI